MSGFFSFMCQGPGRACERLDHAGEPEHKKEEPRPEPPKAEAKKEVPTPKDSPEHADVAASAKLQGGSSDLKGENGENQHDDAQDTEEPEESDKDSSKKETNKITTNTGLVPAKQIIMRMIKDHMDYDLRHSGTLKAATIKAIRMLPSREAMADPSAAPVNNTQFGAKWDKTPCWADAQVTDMMSISPAIVFYRIASLKMHWLSIAVSPQKMGFESDSANCSAKKLKEEEAELARYDALAQALGLSKKVEAMQSAFAVFACLLRLHNLSSEDLEPPLLIQNTQNKRLAVMIPFFMDPDAGDGANAQARSSATLPWIQVIPALNDLVLAMKKGAKKELLRKWCEDHLGPNLTTPVLPSKAANRIEALAKRKKPAVSAFLAKGKIGGK